MRVLSFSETGVVRKNNQDGFLALVEEGLFAVADGMGGHLAGEVAARIALEQLQNRASDLKALTEEEIGNWLKNIFFLANQQVISSANADPANEGMGTTLTALVLQREQAILGHVGDSRAYLWRDQQLHPLTEDHSLVAELVRLGEITPAEAEKHPRRNVLVRAVGAGAQIEVDTRRVERQEKDCYFLFTDGVFNVVSEPGIREIFSEDRPWEERILILKEKILDRGAPDNFTGLCLITE